MFTLPPKTWNNKHYIWTGEKVWDFAGGLWGATEGDDHLIAGGITFDKEGATNGVTLVLFGLGGNDRLDGSGGSDWLQGGLGNDLFSPMAGNDTLDGGEGVDTVDYSGIRWDTYISLEQGYASYGDGSATYRDSLKNIENIVGSYNSDNIQGDSGDNDLRGLDGDDWLDGLEGDDKLYGGDGNDRFMGGEGADEFVVGRGHDIVDDYRPDEGDTVRFAFELSEARVVEDGSFIKVTSGDGKNSVTFWWAEKAWFVKPAPVEPEPEVEPEPVVEPADETESPASSEQPTEPEPQVPSYNPVARIPDSTDGFNIVDGRNPAEVTGAQELSGTNRKDWIRGSDGKDVLRGNSGRDYLEGSGGNDFLSGGNARDWLVGGRGGDRLQGGKQDDILTGGTGRDTFVFKAGHGADIVTDFAVGKDTLALLVEDPAEFSDLTIKKWAKGTGARVEWDEGTIFLEGVQRDALTEDSFEFM